MSRPIPPLNPLRAFEVAARHLSFTRAAEDLFVTPSAVSHQIKTLEESLGVALAKKNWVVNDLTDGLLVRPFGISLPVEFSYFIVYPEERVEDRRIAAFVDWVRQEMAGDQAAASADAAAMSALIA